MPTKGQTIINPTNGDSVEFLETAKDTNGERVTIKAIVNSKGQDVPNHIHVLQDETFEVISGQLTILFAGKTHKLSAGEKIIFLYLIIKRGRNIFLPLFLFT